VRSWAGPTGQPGCQLLPNSAAVTTVATALNVFAAIAVCFGIGGPAVGVGVAERGGVWVADRVGVAVGARVAVGVGVGVGVAVAGGVGVGVGTGAAGVASGGDVTAADDWAAAVAGDEAAGLAALGLAALPWPVVQAAHRTELNAVAASSGSSGRVGRDCQRLRRDKGTRPG
jgi:hypothetical protein